MKATRTKTLLDYAYAHEQATPGKVYLTQPIGGGQVIDYTWAQCMEQARRMAAHLRSLGLPPASHIAILSKNCAHCFIAELAIWMAGCATVEIFPTEEPDTIRFVLEHSDSKLLFVGKLDNWSHQAGGVPATMPRIAFPLAPANAGESWDALVAAQSPLPGKPARDGDELAMLVYTSGSTGQPKGVMHCFANVTRAAEIMAETIDCGPDDRYLSYLPLAHVVERSYIECCSMVAGCHVYFAESLETFVDDIKRARPTLFLSVPRLWLKFQLGVFEKIPPKLLDFLLGIPLVGKLMGHKVLSGLGLNHVRLAGSGSAPTPPELIAWYRRLGLNLMEGYGMSEDFALSHISTAEHNAPGYVGIPFDGVEVRINDDHEVLIKSPGRMVGYYKRPELDAESFTADGFFRTGDQGERRPDGLLKLTGRLKEVFKTAKGKYVAPAPIENLINAHPLVEQSMVTGVGQPAAYALVVLTEHLRGQLGDPAERMRVEQELLTMLKDVNAQLPSYERLQMLVVAHDPWSIENGCLTPTMKIKRRQIEAQASERMAAWYGEQRAVVWG
ncbi:AMP-binding protein [Duganella sp. LX20W]|uniref:AMP-binding protein n=1 Tax=Rugamonas brunnea TaxID=2758569 RepID=A0A7W2ETJ3_9BURK|nr:AMP-binding protein [Rugamonas brunnea]MBA5638349.1 AMP-binding protein [Rugamonas brunnea]